MRQVRTLREDLSNDEVDESHPFHYFLCSVGKSTSVRRETAAVTDFRVHALENDTTTTTGKRKAEQLDIMSDELIEDEESAKVLEIYEDCLAANALNRDNQDLENLDDSVFVQHLYVKGFYKMRNDTTLSFIDLPGINDSDLGAKSKDWVRRNWATLDCAIVVLDAQNGFNTNDQSALIEEVYHMFSAKKCQSFSR